jgi:type IV pilus assembly protein PilZ
MTTACPVEQKEQHKDQQQETQKETQKEKQKENRKENQKIKQQGQQEALRPASSQSNLFFLSIASAEILQSIYLGYIRNGGVFIPATGSYMLGDPVFVLLSLVAEKRKIPMCATVIWITPIQSQENKCPGIGVRFVDSESKVRGMVERCLPEKKSASEKLSENSFHFMM